MMGYDAGVLALVPLLERLDCDRRGAVTFRLGDLELGDLRFLSGTLRLTRPANGKG